MEDEEAQPPPVAVAEADVADAAKNNNKRGSSATGTIKPPKQRSKRIRKRPPRSELLKLHSNDDADDPVVVVKATIQQLAINGIVIPGAPLVRIVHPYMYTFSSFCKERWVGRTILDVYCTEFGSYPATYYETAIQQGRIRAVSDTKVVEDPRSYKLRGKDVLLHTVHRHEPSVAVYSNSTPYIKVVAGETDDIVAFDKPSTLPVHPCGGYYNNSLMTLLQEETSYGKLYTIHRLDRLTSGLVVLAKTSAAAKEWGQAIQQRDCEKIYLARVKGRFCGDHNIAAAAASDNNNNTVPLLLVHTNDGRLPNHGEFEDDSSATAAATDTINALDQDDISRAARSRNAHGYWMTDLAGNPCDVTLEEFTKMEHTVDEWLEALNGAATTTTSDSKNQDSSSLVWFNLACPVRIEQPKIGVCSAGLFADLDAATYQKTVKAAQTAFAVVRYCASDDSTLLLVRPATGRTHQIRIHLQYLGHSIANDPCYGGSLWFGNPDGERACERAQAVLDESNNIGHDGTTSAVAAGATESSLVTADVPATEAELQRCMHNNNTNSNDDAGTSTAKTRGEQEALPDFVERTCVWCARNRCQGIEERAMLEFLVRSPGLWLHALQYKVNSLSFQTELPEWSRF